MQLLLLYRSSLSLTQVLFSITNYKNPVIDNEDIVYRSSIDISVAVAGQKGLVVPVVRDCAKKTFANIEQDISKYAELVLFNFSSTEIRPAIISLLSKT